MSIIKAEGVSIRYITGDFKDIGLKEYVMQRLRGQYRDERGRPLCRRGNHGDARRHPRRHG